MDSDAATLCGSPTDTCGFKIDADNGKIQFTNGNRILKNEIAACPRIRMKYPVAEFCTNTRDVVSCDPAFDENNVITIVVHTVSPTCPITILNAKVYVPPTTPTETEAPLDTEGSNTLVIVLPIVGVIALLIAIGFM